MKGIYQIANQKGYIALMSAIVISVLLLAITAALGLSGFFGRFNVVDSESKERNAALAEACVDQAILEITSGLYRATSAMINIGPGSSDQCVILSSVKDFPTPGRSLIKTQGTINQAYTNFHVIIDNATLDVISWQEVPNH